MIRHPILLAAELVASLVIAWLGNLGLHRPQPEPRPLQFALSAVGEQERPDGSWAGADLLRTPWHPVDRFQLTVRANQAAQLTLFVLDDRGAHQLFPGPGEDGLLAPGRAYALPSPRSFYELQGQVRLRVVLHAPGVHAAPPAAPLAGAPVTRTYPLSDGSAFDAVERGFAGPQAGSVELDLRR